MRVTLVCNVDDADASLQPGAVGRQLLVGDDQQLTVGDRQSGIGVAVLTSDPKSSWLTSAGCVLVGDIQNDQACVPPAAIRAGAADERMVEGVAPGAPRGRRATQLGVQVGVSPPPGVLARNHQRPTSRGRASDPDRSTMTRRNWSMKPSSLPLINQAYGGSQ